MQRTRPPLPPNNVLDESRGKRAGTGAEVQQPHFPLSRLEHASEQVRHAGRGQKLAHPASVARVQRTARLLPQALRQCQRRLRRDVDLLPHLSHDDARFSELYRMRNSFLGPCRSRPSAFWPAAASLLLESLYFSTVKKMVPPRLLRNQTPLTYPLPHAHGRYAKDLSSLFRCDQAHVSAFLTAVAG